LDKLTDNDVLILLQAAESNANTKAASIHQKQTYLALKELYQLRQANERLHESD